MSLLKHTFQSVVRGLVAGLEDGTVTLHGKSTCGDLGQARDDDSEALYRAAFDAAQVHDYGKALELFQRSVEAAGRAGDHHGEWRALARIAALLLTTDPAGAVRHLERALSIARQEGDARMEAQSLYNLACAYAVSDDHQATGYLHHALDAARKQPGVQIDPLDLVRVPELVS